MSQFVRHRFTSLLLKACVALREVTLSETGNWTVVTRSGTCESSKINFRRQFAPYHFVHYKDKIIMGKTGGGFYAVARGRSVGTFMTWDQCKAQVDGFPNARYKKFSTSEEAQAFIEEHRTKPGSATTTSSFGMSAKSSSKSRTIATTMTLAKSKTSGNSVSASSKPGFAVSKSGISSKAVSTSSSSFQSGQKRGLSSLKVTEDRVINKRAKFDSEQPNAKANLSGYNVDEEGYVIVFTDGACTKNGRKAAKAGIGVWFGHNHPLNISEPVDGRQTNNTAEIQAAERAIRQAKTHGINKIQLKTDSQFTINCVTKWLNNWRRNNWRLSSGGEVKNKDDLIKLDAAMQNMEIKWSYVAGHAGIEGNEAADRLAVAGAERSM